MGYKVLYIDCDTLVLNPLDELFSFNNIALRDELPYSVILEPKFIEKLDKEDQITVLKHNFNFGVIYVPDKSHIGLLDAYGSMFTKYLTNQKSDRGDQFFFNLTAHLLDYNIQRLEKKYNHFSLMWDGPVSADTVICHFAGFKGDVYSEHINRYKDNILKLKLDAIRDSL
jgi:lipopolysaccharide biosynthesis glycosyltransferase